MPAQHDARHTNPILKDSNQHNGWCLMRPFTDAAFALRTNNDYAIYVCIYVYLYLYAKYVYML